MDNTSDPMNIPDDSATQPTPAATPAPAAQPTTPTAAPAPATPAAAPAAPAAAPVAAPSVVHPVKRGGLAGIVDEIRDALAPNTTQKVYQDANGDKFIKQEGVSHKGQWLKIAADAFRNAGAGLAAGKGGNPGLAITAGFDSQDRANAMRKRDTREQTAEVKQQQLDKFNMIKLKHDNAAADFALTRMKVAATDHDVEFSQKQQDRERELGSADLGVYADLGALADVQKNDPNFWKNVYANDIVTVPEIAPNGERKGIHVYLRTPGVGNQPVPKGTQVMDYVPGKKPGDAPTLVPRTLTTPATQNQVDSWNNAAQKKYQDFLKDKTDREDKEAQIRQRDSEVTKNKAEANKANAEAEASRATTKNIAQGEDAVTNDIAQGLAAGRYLAGKDIPIRTSKGQKGADAYAKAANDYSMAHYGLPYSPELIRQESHMANSDKTQAFLTGIDRMVGSPGAPGQLDQVLDLAAKAGLNDDSAPVNTVKQWVKRKLGDTAAKNFEQGLSDTQTAMGTLIGNPLLGSGESDLKLKTAQGQFGSNATLGNLKGAAKTAKEILSRARTDLAKNNRYIQQRYGETESPRPNTPPGGGGGTAVSLSQARQLPEWKGKTDDQIKAAIKAAGHQVVD